MSGVYESVPAFENERWLLRKQAKSNWDNYSCCKE